MHMWEVAFTEHILNIKLAFIYIKNIPDSLSVTYVYDIYIYIYSVIYIYIHTHTHTWKLSLLQSTYCAQGHTQIIKI